MSVSYRKRSQYAVEPIPELVSFVERQVRDSIPFDGYDRRSEKRHMMVVPVTTVAVDDHYRAIGRPFAVVTRDVSPKGLGFVHTDPFGDKLLALRFSLVGEDVVTVACVRWQRGMGPFYYSGADFVTQLDRFPVWHPGSERV